MVSGLGNSLMGLLWMFSEPSIDLMLDGNDSISSRLRHPCGSNVSPAAVCVTDTFMPPISMLSVIVEIACI